MPTAGSTGSINLVEKASPKVLERFKQKSVTEGLFSHEYTWDGVATVRIPSVDVVPLNDYNQERVDGGSRYGQLINLGDTWQEHTVKERKSFMFAIDNTYNTQQLQIKKASRDLKREVDEVVIPYTDKYRIRKMALAANSTNKNIASATLTSANIIETIFDANAAMSENLIPTEGRTLFISYKNAVKYQLADQVVGAPTYGGPVGNGSLGQRVILNGYLGNVDGCDIVRVPAGYLPPNVEFMIVKKGICFAPTQLKEFAIHDGAHVLSGKICTGLIQHDCFVPQGREKAIFVITTSGDGSIVIVGTGVMTASSTDLTISSNAFNIVKTGGDKHITVDTKSSGVVTADVISVASSDEKVVKVAYDPYTGVITVTPNASGTTSATATITIKGNGRIGYSTPADITLTATLTAS